MKRALNYLVSAVMAIMLLAIPNHQIYAADVSLGVSASSVNIGDSVTVTITIPENVTGTIDLSFSKDVLTYSSASAEVGVNSGVITLNIGKLSMAGSNKMTVTFKAASTGTADLKAKVIAAYDNDSLEDVSLGGASASVTVKNETTSESESDEKSSDYYLASLKLSNGSKSISLSPTFKYSKTKYTATVNYDVTNVVVGTKLSSGKAEITSITGNGNVDLKVGANVIEIVVKAESGKTLTYTITVTRKEKVTESQNPSSSESEAPTPSENPSEEPATPDFQVNGVELYVQNDIPDSVIPTGFGTKKILLNGNKEVTALSLKNGDLTVLYMEDANEVDGLYIYNVEENYVYPFIKLISEKSFAIVLTPDSTMVPEGYTACTLSLEGKGIANAYQYQAVENNDYYLLYCINEDGVLGWYQYDLKEGTYQRYAGIIPADNTQNDTEDTENTENSENTEVLAPDNSDLQNQYKALEKELQEAKELQRLVICIAVFVVAVLVIIIINLLLAKHRGDSDYEEDDEDDDEDDDEYEEFDDKQVFQKKKSEEIGGLVIPEVTIDEEEIEASEVEIPEVEISEDANETNSEEELEFIDL